MFLMWPCSFQLLFYTPFKKQNQNQSAFNATEICQLLEFILPGENNGGGVGKWGAQGNPVMECSSGKDNWVPWMGCGLEAAAGVVADVAASVVPS